jgi:HEPN domain-containing protein
MKEKAHKLFKDAFKKLYQANAEISRPEEDIISYVVCKNAQVAIENYLKGFLYENGIDASNFSTIDELFEQCKRINNKFEKIKLSTISCKSEEFNTAYCNDITRVSNCFYIANDLDTFLGEEEIID